MPSETRMQTAKPGLLTRLAFGVGGVAEGVKNNGFEYFLVLYYSQVLGVSAGLVAAALMIALAFDAFSDPIVGYWSDNVRSRFGRRHPFMYAAIIPVAIGYYFAWNPPNSLSGNELFPWLIVLAIFVRLSFTLFEVPSNALAAELTDDYDARTSLISIRTFFAWMGGLSIQLLLLLVLLKPTPDDPTGFFNGDGWQLYGVVAATAIFTAAFISTAGTHSHIPHLKAPPPTRHLTIAKIFAEILQTISNPSFRALFLATLFGLLASGISATLNQYINAFFWGFDTNDTGKLTLVVFGSAAAALFIAPIVGRTLGKKRGALIIGFLAFTIAPLLVFLRLLGLMPANDSPALFPIVFWVTAIDLALIIATQMLMASMVADIVEDSEVDTGRRSEGVFFAGISFIRKLSQATGVITASVILSMASIQRGMQPSDVSEASLQSLGWGYGLALITAWMLMILCVSFYKIGRADHERNLEKLQVSRASN